MSEADVETVRASYEALNRGDVDAALEALDPEAVWRDSPELPGGGEFRGRESLRRFLQDFLAEWRDFHQEVEDTVLAGDRVAVVHPSERGGAIERDRGRHPIRARLDDAGRARGQGRCLPGSRRGAW